MTAYYNENDPYAAQWLRNLIAANHIAAGDVDERSIEDVEPEELRGYKQCHFFAGIGVWSHALRLAGWPDDREIWTGSCPCQPFSSAGKGGGFADERHLWPTFFYLIGKLRPPIVFGEQVGGRNGLTWFDLVQSDMEGLDYACGAVVAPAAGFGAPHVRERLYWASYSNDSRSQGWDSGDGVESPEQPVARERDSQDWSDDSNNSRFSGSEQDSKGKARDETRMRVSDIGCSENQLEHAKGDGREQRRSESSERRTIGGRGEDRNSDAEGKRWDGWKEPEEVRDGRGLTPSISAETNGFWADAKWLPGIDGRWRPTKPGLQPVAYGVANRVGKLRAYGNAICAPQAAEFIKAFMEFKP